MAKRNRRTVRAAEEARWRWIIKFPERMANRHDRRAYLSQMRKARRTFRDWIPGRTTGGKTYGAP